MAKTIQVEIACANCGSVLFAFPHNPPAAEDPVSCAECGEHIGLYDAIRARARKACEEVRP